MMLRKVTPRSLMIPGSTIAVLIVLISLGADPTARDIPLWYPVFTAIFILRPVIFPIVFREQYASAEADCAGIGPSPAVSRIAFVLVSAVSAVLLMPRSPGTEGVVDGVILTTWFWLAVVVALVHGAASPVVWPLARRRAAFTGRRDRKRAQGQGPGTVVSPDRGNT
ncbi:hypothetical protein [Streptomyces sp. NPDC059452]|uniref:hypothetical protein n=1 Tax=Streptomyces sp. NPDC059452 TaxID=3346835 RepID=UPI00369043DE